MRAVLEYCGKNPEVGAKTTLDVEFNYTGSAQWCQGIGLGPRGDRPLDRSRSAFFGHGG